MKIETEWHFANYKPIFMKEIFALQPAGGTVFYFDPDIVVRASWSFFLEWAQYGIAVCEDVNSPLHARHPRRLRWRTIFSDFSFNDRICPVYANGGFVGVPYELRDFLDLWAKLLVRASAHTGGPGNWYALEPWKPFSVIDQDALNVALMASSMPLSIVGKDGMDFAPGGYIMSHAVGQRKPWRGSFSINALRGSRPSMADRQYVENANGSIVALSPAKQVLMRIDLTVGRILGRLLC